MAHIADISQIRPVTVFFLASTGTVVSSAVQPLGAEHMGPDALL